MKDAIAVAAELRAQLAAEEVFFAAVRAAVEEAKRAQLDTDRIGAMLEYVAERG